MTSSNRALLCDLDGTLADTIPTMAAVYKQFVSQHGGEPTVDEFQRLNGVPIDQAVESLARTHGWTIPTNELTVLYERSIDERYEEAPARSGAHELLAAASDAGWACGVVTSGKRTRAQAWLRGTGLEELVDAIVGADDVRRGKPHPEPYLLALSRLHADPRGSVAVEDSALGVEAARAAGLRTFYVGPEPRDFGHHVTVISDLRSLIDEISAS